MHSSLSSTFTYTLNLVLLVQSLRDLMYICKRIILQNYNIKWAVRINIQVFTDEKLFYYLYLALEFGYNLICNRQK